MRKCRHLLLICISQNIPVTIFSNILCKVLCQSIPRYFCLILQSQHVLIIYRSTSFLSRPTLFPTQLIRRTKFSSLSLLNNPSEKGYSSSSFLSRSNFLSCYILCDVLGIFQNASDVSVKDIYLLDIFPTQINETDLAFSL